MAGKLLNRVVLTDRVVTGDALYCNRNLCEQVMDAGRDYLMVVKANQKSFYEEIAFCFQERISGKYAYAETEGRHEDRWETRRLWATDMLRTYHDWAGLEVVPRKRVWERILSGLN